MGVPITFTNPYIIFLYFLILQVDLLYLLQHQTGLIGSRPFFTLGNYTYRSPFLPSLSNPWYAISRGST